MSSPADRIRLIEDSLYCYVLGWCSLIPIVGLPLFVLALRTYQSTRILSAGQWNPAGRYLSWGMILASIGGFISAAAFGAVVLMIIHIGE